MKTRTDKERKLIRAALAEARCQCNALVCLHVYRAWGAAEELAAAMTADRARRKGEK